MGAPMARNLATAGFDVRVWNRTRKKAEPLAADGIEVAATPADAVDGADVVLTMLRDGPAVHDTVNAVTDELAADALWLQMSTVGVAHEAALQAFAADHGIAYVDAPVLGTKQPAEQGQLLVFASGPEQLQERADAVFEPLAREVRWLGAAGRGSRLKLVVNSWVLLLATGTAEAMALAEGLGLEPRQFLDAIAGGALDVPYAHLKGNAILTGEFPAAFPVDGAEKDSALVAEAARDAGVRLELPEAVHRQFARAVEMGHAREDMAAVWYATRG